MQATVLLRLDDDEMLAADGNALRGSHDLSSGQTALQRVTAHTTKAGGAGAGRGASGSSPQQDCGVA
ncbi:MAG: hypothetical protein KatS3mg052_1404 [Candidatus Roseilinea sp.]|nr:MAG: hypothetical protein KatS3mg052_1404 [Candidatus Roseilinea sp.]